MRLHRTLIAGLTAAAFAAGLAATAPAALAASTQEASGPQPAADSAPTGKYAWGEVVSPIGINIRARPTTESATIGTLEYQERVALECKVESQDVDGNNLWYSLHGQDGWVAARYVQNLSHVPYC